MNSRDLTIAGYLAVLVAAIALQVTALRVPERLPSLGRVITMSCGRVPAASACSSRGRGSDCTSSPADAYRAPPAAHFFARSATLPFRR